MTRSSHSSDVVLALSALADLQSSGADLESLLRRFSHLLIDVLKIPLLPQSALLLFNDARQPLQVAQWNIPSPWEHPVRWRTDPPGKGLSGDVVLCTGGLDTGEESREVRLLVLPLRHRDHDLGSVVQLARPDAALTGGDMCLLRGLARTLSAQVDHILIEEILAVRKHELDEAKAETLHRLGIASEYRDDGTGVHVARMTAIALAIADALGLPPDQRELLRLAAPMHDVGKIGIPDHILLKPGKLTPAEFDIIKTHTTIGEVILAGDDPLLLTAREIAAAHHERWDGSGYPRGLKGDEIPVLARISAVADVFDALVSQRPYKTPWSVEDARDWIQSQSGLHFDPRAVDAFLQALPEIRDIRDLYRDAPASADETAAPPPGLPSHHRRPGWTGEQGTGIGMTDQHRHYLLPLIDDLVATVVRDGAELDPVRLIRRLTGYVNAQFHAEERMMRHRGNEYSDAHRIQHLKFQERIQAFRCQLHRNPIVAKHELLGFLLSWLPDHLKQEDARLSRLLPRGPQPA